MQDTIAIEKVKNRYLKQNIDSIVVEQVTEELLNQMLQVCDRTKHMEERTEWYDEENNPEKNNWIDVEGEGYGWVWLNHPEEKWHEVLRDSLLEYLKEKKAAVAEKVEYVIIVNMDNSQIYHFIERDSSMCDTIYTFSDEEIYY